LSSISVSIEGSVHEKAAGWQANVPDSGPVGWVYAQKRGQKGLKTPKNAQKRRFYRQPQPERKRPKASVKRQLGGNGLAAASAQHTA
jgi:hypothetical protein